MNNVRCYSPIDGALVVERPFASLADTELKLANVRKAQRDWAATPLTERIRLVQNGIAQLGTMNDDIVQELALQMGRPVRYGGEFGGVKERADYMANIADSALAPIEIEKSDQFHRYIRRAPVGVVLVVAPWNYPFMTAVNTLVPALIAGNAVVLKHASQTPLAGERLAQAMHLGGVPEEVMVNLFLDHETCSKLIEAGAFNLVNFTGSVAGGRSIARSAALSCTPVGLELGGKDPAYVMDDADVDAAVSCLIDAAMYNSGQCCCGIERIYVANSLYKHFVDRAVSIAENYVLGNPLDQATTLGPMAQQRLAELVRNQTREAINQGAKALVNPTKFPADGGAYLMPQILVEVTHAMRVMREESFGPIVGIMPVDSDAEATALMNDSDYGLTASLWTKDRERAKRVGEQLENGTVFMNRADYLDPALCWGGCKHTGRGGSLSAIGFANLTRPQSFHLKSDID